MAKQLCAIVMFITVWIDGRGYAKESTKVKFPIFILKMERKMKSRGRLSFSYNPKLIADFNEEFKKRALELFPRNIEIETSNLAEAIKKYEFYKKYLEDTVTQVFPEAFGEIGLAGDAIGKIEPLINGYGDKNLFCFKGSGHEAVRLISSLSGSILSDNFLLYGYKYRGQVYPLDGSLKTIEEVVKSEVKSSLWQRWREHDDVLMLISENLESDSPAQELPLRQCSKDVGNK